MSKHTLESIARLAGVSRGTVSRVVNRQPGVKNEVREKVLSIIEQTGYYPNSQARSLAGGRTENIGVVVFGDDPLFLKHHLFYEVLQGIQSHSTLHHYDLLLFSNRSESDKEYWKQIGDKRKVDGFIIMGEYIKEEYLQYYSERKLPFVLVGKRKFEHVTYPCVTSDYRQGAYKATQHLLGQNNKRIVCIQGIPDSYHEDEKLAGYRMALEASSIPYDSELIVQGEADQHKAAEAVKKLLRKEVTFDAIFAGNDLMAMGAIQALHEHGLNVPHDVSVVGYDDIAAAAFFHPPLTTVSQPKTKLGQEAAELLIKIIQREADFSEPAEIMVTNELIIRGSSVKRID
ncbi:LacI family DNA-binding transcriptional regulator [Marinicrinis lubricantis]|uniref:LacI family DNA-binding transcriptional regulator n=1 Tax=Marinicrinis lubricantis TaxID=2086470 RepID=A0ABW1IV66_9BACL